MAQILKFKEDSSYETTHEGPAGMTVVNTGDLYVVCLHIRSMDGQKASEIAFLWSQEEFCKAHDMMHELLGHQEAGDAMVTENASGSVSDEEKARAFDLLLRGATRQ